MAKIAKGSDARKISFGKRKKGKAQKRRGPKDKDRDANQFDYKLV